MDQTKRKPLKCLKSIQIPLMIIGYINSTAHKKSFPLRISSVNVTKSAILLKKFFMENFIFCVVQSTENKEKGSR